VQDAVYVRRELRGSELNGVEPQTSREWIRNRFPLSRAQQQGEHHAAGVRIVKIIEDPTPGRLIYDPQHPDANEEGYVELPNVEMLNEMVNMMGASRSYEANVQVVNAMRTMAMRTLDIGR
jgi:flagellar basal-body rod protein FlgC